MGAVFLCSCGAPAEALCSWLVKKFIPVPVEELEVGDFVCRWKEEKPRNGSTAQVRSITWFNALPTVTLWVKPAMKMPREVRVRFDDRTKQEIKALRLAPCQNGVCSLHGRDPADGYRLCSEHANAWEKVA